MTYETDMAAIGANCDQAIASKTGQPATTSHHDAAANLGKSFDADLAAAKPPAVTTKFGASCGDSVAATVNLVHPKRVRDYNQGQLGSSKTAGVHEFHHSEKVDQVKLAARDPATMTSVKSLFLAVEAGRVTINHERDNDTAFSKTSGSPNQKDAQVYQAAWAVFLEIIAGINTGRDAAHKLITVDVTTGILYRQGTPEWWIVKGADEHGADIYDSNNLDVVYNKLSSLGYQNWSLPETGFSAGLTGALPSDDQMLAKLQADYAKYMGYPHPPKSVFFFNNNDSEFQNKPKTAAWIASLCAKG